MLAGRFIMRCTARTSVPGSSEKLRIYQGRSKSLRDESGGHFLILAR